MKNKKTNENKPGNDILNGIERWIPDGSDRPKQFTYEACSKIWYKNKREEGTCLARAGVPESEWYPVPGDPFESEAGQAEGV